jgi:hypothetical protein
MTFNIYDEDKDWLLRGFEVTVEARVMHVSYDCSMKDDAGEFILPVFLGGAPAALLWPAKLQSICINLADFLLRCMTL